MHKITLPSAALIALLATAACGADPSVDRVAELPAAEDVEEVADEEAPADEPSELELDFGGSYTFDDGLVVEMTNVHRGTSGEWAMPENAPYVGWTLQLQNGTGQALDTSFVYIDCQVGEEGRRAEEVFDYDEGLGDGFTSTLMDGRNATADYACEIPAEETYLQVELSVNDDIFERPTVFFVGDVE